MTFAQRLRIACVSAALVSSFWTTAGPSAQQSGDALAQHRNLGKAFYENPTTQQQAVAEFKAALDLAPASARERVNYGLALLKAAKTDEGIAELQRAQQLDPSIPHTWFNLGIAFKKASDYPKAIAAFEQMVKLVPSEPVSHYNLGYLYKLNEKPAEALREFETAAKLDPNLAGPHFQLYNSYREAGRAADAAREQATFQEIKKRQAGAAVPEDLDWSYYAEILDPADPASANDEAAPAPLKFQDRSLPGAMNLDPPGLVAADVDADGRPDLIAWSADGIRIYKNGETPVAVSGLEDAKGVRAVVAGDYNNDGFPDLCVLTDGGAALYTNYNGRFTRSSAALPAGPFNAAVFLDYDHDYDVDLFLFGSRSTLMRNNGQAGFSDESKNFPFVDAAATSAITLDLIPDTSGRDIVVTYLDRRPVLYKDLLAGKFEARTLEEAAAGQTALAAADLDGDSATDLVFTGDSSVTVLFNRNGRFEPVALTGARGAAAALVDFDNRGLVDIVTSDRVFRNQGSGRFVAAEGSPVGASVAATAADFDGDGKVDVALVRPDGSLHLLRNESASANAWIGVRLAGVKNLKLASQAQVEVKAGQRYLKRSYDGLPIVFGLRNAAQVDTVRITWPNGLIQNEVRQPVRAVGQYKEAQRLSGSCPMIFTWNGRGFQFITDVLGVAPLGASSGDGTYFPVDHDEYVQIPGSALAMRDGEYEIRVTEELHEVSYLDQLKLIAVDHPASVDLFTNDKFKSPPYPEFRLFGATKRIHPVRARDDAGRDVTGAVAARDSRYPDRFKRNLAGVAELHTLDLDFGRVAPDNRAVLILNGWVDWADGSTFLGASQEDPKGLVFPALQVKDDSGAWKTVIEDMGIPAGKPKTIAVDLTGKFLSASREVRIVTNLCVYWDEIFLGEHADMPDVVMTPMDARAADLQFRGFSTPRIDADRKQPETFDYARVMPVSMWNPTPGLYTRYGDVTPLTRTIDDLLVIMGSGDELRLRYAAARLPRVRAGWTRDFLLRVDGWAKDADPNTAFSQSVEPLPFHGMTAYPYTHPWEQFPDDQLHRNYRDTYNTRPALRLLRSLTTPSFEATHQ
jgi:tetratricopeptide (TPR) repeat protein